MDDRRFDQFTRSLIAQPCTRRRWLRGWVGFVLGSWLARRGTAGAAEEAAGECGRVGDACAADGDCCAGARCANNGTCVCRAGRTDCGDGRCRDLQIDERNCGGCGTACRADQVCLDGACACPDGRPECRGRCCPAGSACLGLGLCCPADRACGLACCAADQVCRRAGAISVCRGATALGEPCTRDEGCSTGVCCAGVCRDLQTDEANCGRCGRLCPAGKTCETGLCNERNDGRLEIGDECHPDRPEQCRTEHCVCANPAAAPALCACRAPTCKAAGERCLRDNACCLGACERDQAFVLRCCNPRGAVCTPATADLCCGGGCVGGRCCNRPGTTCSAGTAAFCCSGTCLDFGVCA